MTATTKTDCLATGMCHYDSLTRTKFFDGMLLTDESLVAEQTYHREALKRVNRYLWGSGIVCGLEVQKVSGLCIRVRPGAALDCQGNLIELCRCVTIDLTDTCKKQFPGACIPESAGEIIKYLAVRYADIGADPQPVLAADDECTSSGQGTRCQASKTREGFCFELLDECPDSPLCPEEEGMLATYTEARAETPVQAQAGIVAHVALAQAPGAVPPGAAPSAAAVPAQAPAAVPQKQMSALDKLEKRQSMDQSPPCPQCGCTDSFVGLAKLTIKCGESVVDVEADCRSYVWTPGLLRTLVCKLLAGYDQKANQAVPALAPERRWPKVEQMMRDPFEGLRRALVYMAVAQETPTAPAPSPAKPKGKPKPGPQP
jgi:hypothetical protein